MFKSFNPWAASLVSRIEALRNEAGQTFVEYALILAVVVVGVLLAATWTGLSGAINSAIGIVVSAL
jgi:Flp pilus assembly pilin Flp